MLFTPSCCTCAYVFSLYSYTFKEHLICIFISSFPYRFLPSAFAHHSFETGRSQPPGISFIDLIVHNFSSNHFLIDFKTVLLPFSTLLTIDDLSFSVNVTFSSNCMMLCCSSVYSLTCSER